MSDVRLVKLMRTTTEPDCPRRDNIVVVMADPNGTHLLVPVERASTLIFNDHVCAYDIGIVHCKTCGGSGMKMSKMPTAKWPESTVESDCPHCNGRGWRLSDE